ncbi:MAG: Gx transporter family protein [Clostridia bacterium]|nr:Gx transporter family protein [Clostridia bacterium]
MKKDNTINIAYKTALCAILCAQALALSWLENLLPALPYMPPGAKPGFSNIVTMFTAGSLGIGQAMTVTFIKAGFAFLTRGATAGVMSLAGGALSTFVMWLLLRFSKEKSGLIGISVVCAAAHNTAQLAVAAFITGTKSVLYYAPFLGLYAVVTGTVTGILLKAVMPALEKQKNLFIRK